MVPVFPPILGYYLEEIIALWACGEAVFMAGGAKGNNSAAMKANMTEGRPEVIQRVRGINLTVKQTVDEVAEK